MVYMGSKNRIAKDIIPFMLPFLDGKNRFIDAFCGGCNLIDKINYPHRVANDVNEYLIELFRYYQNGGGYMEISKEEYDKVKNNKDNYHKWYVGYTGLLCSFKGKMFNGWIKPITITKKGIERNYQKELFNNFNKQLPSLNDVTFTCGNYQDIQINRGDVVYCDPPYEGTTAYKVDRFSHSDFWQWCRNKSINGNIVFISEYNAPSDFRCIWEKKINMSLDGNGCKQATEKLFVHESIYDLIMSKKLTLF